MDTELRYEGWFKPFSVPFGLGPQQSDVSITNDSLHVSMGWGFRADIPLSSITSPSRATTASTRGACMAGADGGW